MKAPTQYGWSPATEAIMKEVDWEGAAACGMARAALIAERADAEAAIGQLRAQAQLVIDAHKSDDAAALERSLINARQADKINDLVSALRECQDLLMAAPSASIGGQSERALTAIERALEAAADE